MVKEDWEQFKYYSIGDLERPCTCTYDLDKIIIPNKKILCKKCNNKHFKNDICNYKYLIMCKIIFKYKITKYQLNYSFHIRNSKRKHICILDIIKNEYYNDIDKYNKFINIFIKIRLRQYIRSFRKKNKKKN